VIAPERTEPGLQAAEREMLTGWLDYYRATLAVKCSGLAADQLRLRAVPPSPISLLGLVRHLTDMERGWFRQILAAEDVPDLYRLPDRPDGDFDDVDDAEPDAAFHAWHDECAAARRIVDAAPSLDVTGTQDDETFSLRWILTHMIAEYSRHLGHADLVRERIDGATGE
jgi:uncharacterized damage-inducible protein DinB